MWNLVQIWQLYLAWYSRHAWEVLGNTTLRLLGLPYFTPLAWLALGLFLLAVLLAVIAVIVLLSAGKPIRICPHGVRTGGKYKITCPLCTRRERLLDEQYARLHPPGHTAGKKIRR